MDLQLGRVIKALNNSPYKDNTIIVLWSDHGWMLGQKEGWEKFKPWEQSVRVPFLMKVPGKSHSVVSKPVELLSIFPTLVELTGIPKKDGVDGVSLKPLLDNPNAAWNYPVITANRESNGGWQSIRTQQYRYIRYMKNGEEEFYDHTTDSLEWYNLANDPKMLSVKAELNSYLPKEWTTLGSWNNWKMPVVRVLNSKVLHARIPVSIKGSRVYFSLKNNEPLELSMFDIKGNLVFKRSNEDLSPHRAKGYFDLPASIAGSRLYILRVTAGDQVFSEKYVPLKRQI
jgi:hypothetical protein